MNINDLKSNNPEDMRNKQIEEMKTALNNYFDNTPMELSFEHENGDTDIITDEKALGVIDAITRQALIPVFCKALYNAGYRKQSESVIELPCKVGDEVYMPWEWEDTSGIAILTVERISITEAGRSIRTDFWSDDEDYWLAYNCGVFRFNDIGKVVFLTKEEAEKAFVERRSKNAKSRETD